MSRPLIRTSRPLCRLLPGATPLPVSRNNLLQVAAAATSSPQQPRCYAKSASSPKPRGPKPVDPMFLKPGSREARQRVASARMPPVEDFAALHQKQGLQEGDPELHWACAAELIKAIKNNDLEGPKLLKRLGVTLEEFFNAAIFISLTRPTIKGCDVNEIVVEMLMYASSLGHEASTISAMHLYPLIARVLHPACRPPAELAARFAAIVERGDDANALTVAGRMAIEAKKYDEARALCERALQVGGGQQQQQPTQRQTFDFHANCLEHKDVRAGYYLLYPGPLAEEIWEATEFALTVGHERAYRHLMSMHNDQAAEALAKGDKAAFADFQFLAQEWQRLEKAKTVGDV
ncbi:unnamed protein product [Parascedosporium putredinis]|uniref:Uncharacterized protein n=1 Tax=Parascedosporium putredinis TaxID=1442378 RepID=A0A9P1H6D3_9PEZI|nr:unnamed protein product [Parascedosporium putredinis]CAI8000128.1 unnamed protein product [Parascedosporium putredinis]